MKRAALFLLLLSVAAHGDKVVAVPQGGLRIMGGGVVIFGGQQQVTPADTSPAVPTLRWKNGETLPGDLVGASESSLNWKSAFFEDPLQVRWDVIDRIDWPANPVQPKDPFAIALRDGSFIYGDLSAISADTISIRSTRHGDAVLKRSEVLSIRRRQNAKLVYAGPIGDVGWEPMINQQDGSVARNSGQFDTTSPVVTGPGGALLIRSWNRSAFLTVTLPQALDVEFRLHSSKRPEFLVALGGNVREPLRVETWDNVLVLAAGDQFKIIRRIQDDERNIALRVCWDPATQECSVFAPSGEPITTWKLSTPPATSTPGFVVQNRGLDLSLDELRVRAWDGKAPARVDPKQARVDLDDGRTVGGTSVSGSQGMLSVQSPGSSTAATFPLGQIDAIVFSPDSPQTPAHATSLAFNDETLLYGHLAGLDKGRAAFATSFTSQPLSVQMDSPRQLLTAPSDQPAPANQTTQAAVDGQDQISLQDTTLHGKLGTTADGALGWMPVGGIAAARPTGTLPIEITRAVPKDAPLPGDPALFYLNFGRRSPGDLAFARPHGSSIRIEPDGCAAASLRATGGDPVQPRHAAQRAGLQRSGLAGRQGRRQGRAPRRRFAADGRGLRRRHVVAHAERRLQLQVRLHRFLRDARAAVLRGQGRDELDQHSPLQHRCPVQLRPGVDAGPVRQPVSRSGPSPARR